MPIPKKLEEKIQNLEREADEIESNALQLISNAPLKYHSMKRGNVIAIGFSEYSWDILPKELREIQSKVIGTYRSWYNSSCNLIEKYLPNEIREFNKYYQKKEKESKNGVIDFLQFNIQVWKGDKSDVISEFKKTFSNQSNILSSIKYLQIEDYTVPNEEIDLVRKFGKQIFIVHGHDEGMKESVARVLTKLNLEPIILHEQANEGKTIIEKFEDYSDVGFAIVLLSPDDECRKKNQKGTRFSLRVRQNVIFEMGYFIGKLGRERVVLLFKQDNKFEFPSDYHGVLYILYDDAEGWKLNLIKELNSQGYNVDANLLFD